MECISFIIKTKYISIYIYIGVIVALIDRQPYMAIGQVQKIRLVENAAIDVQTL